MDITPGIRKMLPAHESFGGSLNLSDVEVMRSEVTLAVVQLLEALRIQPDENTVSTPSRVARMLIDELFVGRYQPCPVITDFSHSADLDQIYAVGPIQATSTCAHHLMPIIGKVWVGVVPSDRVLGLSKFHRLTDWIMRRPHIQEQATAQLADLLEQAMAPRALAVLMRATHGCVTCRGVKDAETLMTTSITRGLFREDPRSRAELMAILSAMGFN